MGTFDVPFHVLAFDDARVGSTTTDGVQAAGQAPQDGVAAAVAHLRVARGESRPGGRPTGV